jgi:hypothetical protein
LQIGSQGEEKQIYQDMKKATSVAGGDVLLRPAFSCGKAAAGLTAAEFANSETGSDNEAVEAKLADGAALTETGSETTADKNTVANKAKNFFMLIPPEKCYPVKLAVEN